MRAFHSVVLAGAVATLTTVDARQSFLQGLPNGSGFPKALGHSGNGYTAFGGMFSGTWSASLCKSKFPGSSITVGQAFGDPCCTWQKGGKPDFTVSYTADFPAQSTQTCASGGGGAAAGGAGGSAPAPAPAPANGGGGGTSGNGGGRPSSGDGRGNSGVHGHGDSDDDKKSSGRGKRSDGGGNRGSTKQRNGDGKRSYDFGSTPMLRG